MTTYEQAKSEWKVIQTLNPKHKYRDLKKLCFSLELSSKPTVEEIDFFSFLIARSVKTLGSPGKLKKKLAELALAKCRVLGIAIESIENSLKKNFKLQLNTATVGIGDQLHLDKDWFEKEKDAVESGKVIFFHTAADGLHHIQLRVVQAPEPILTIKEYKRIGSVSSSYIIHVPSGKIAISDFCLKDTARIFEVPPGNYKVMIYLFYMKVNISYYVCLAPTTECAKNTVVQDAIPTLED